ncbi:MAG TPA: rhomboid family intramembrane serine protease [Gemmatimonadales bacterium]|nr:rhomboid family intramembrane serine protease [Gemmatimonadales bacterium]
MFPYRDDNPTVLTPLVTVGIILANALVWLLVQGAGFSEEALARSVCNLGLVPGELLGTAAPGTTVPLSPHWVCRVDPEPAYATLVTSMFLHGGWLHILGNMMFLWVFGNNIEDAMGHARFLVFYLLCGLAAAGAQILVDPDSPVPMVGASGAISGVLGGYLLLYPHARVHTLVFFGFYVTTIALPAYIMLGYWIFLQVLGGLPALAGLDQGGGVAFWAHIGGFVAGLALIRLFARPENLARRRVAVTYWR